MKGVADRTPELLNEFQKVQFTKSYRDFQHFLVVRIEQLEDEIKRKEALRERIEKTLERAECFASDEVDVGMNHQIGRWMGIADAHKETLALLKESD